MVAYKICVCFAVGSSFYIWSKIVISLYLLSEIPLSFIKTEWTGGLIVLKLCPIWGTMWVKNETFGLIFLKTRVYEKMDLLDLSDWIYLLSNLDQAKCEFKLEAPFFIIINTHSNDRKTVNMQSCYNILFIVDLRLTVDHWGCIFDVKQSPIIHMIKNVL